MMEEPAYFETLRDLQAGLHQLNVALAASMAPKLDHFHPGAMPVLDAARETIRREQLASDLRASLARHMRAKPRNIQIDVDPLVIDLPTPDAA